MYWLGDSAKRALFFYKKMVNDFLKFSWMDEFSNSSFRFLYHLQENFMASFRMMEMIGSSCEVQCYC